MDVAFAWIFMAYFSALLFNFLIPHDSLLARVQVT